MPQPIDLRPGVLRLRGLLATRSRSSTFISLEEFVGELKLDDELPVMATGARKWLNAMSLVFGGLYVHLPFKHTRYAATPIDSLKALERNLPMPPSDFYRALLNIFGALHDPHTFFLLPEPYSTATAFLPFRAAAAYGSQPKPDSPGWMPDPMFFVTEVARELAADLAAAGFQLGTQITHWNGMPMDAMVHQLALRENGANPDACFAKAVDNLTIRPLSRMLIPDAPTVTLRFNPPADSNIPQGSEVQLEWSVRKKGNDSLTRLLFPIRHPNDNPPWQSWDSLPIERIAYQILRLEHPTAREPVAVGLIRINSFRGEVESFVNRFRELIDHIRKEAPLALILDVRGNRGGNIPAAERILQLFTPGPITPASFQFLNTPLLHDLVRKNPMETARIGEFGLETDTGAVFSRAAYLTSFEQANAIGQRYYGRVALITDALCYSATDIFAAGFQDHRIGPVIGVHQSTGGGGANAWSYASHVANKVTDDDWKFPELPNGANMQFSVRHSLRTGRFQGKILEDFGVTPDYRYLVMKDDLIGCDVGLYNFAFSKLLLGAGLKEIDIDLRITKLVEFNVENDRFRIDCQTAGITRAEILVDDQTISVADVRDEGGRWTELSSQNWLTKKLQTVELRCYSTLPAAQFPFFTEAERTSMKEGGKYLRRRVASRKFTRGAGRMRISANNLEERATPPVQERPRCLLYYVSGNGRKNAQDSLAIVKELRAILSDVAIRFVSHGSGSEVLRGSGEEVIDLGLPDCPPLFAVQDKFESELTKWEQEFRPLMVVAHEEPYLPPLLGSAQDSNWPWSCVLIVNHAPGTNMDWHRETLVLGNPKADPDRRIHPVGPILRTSGIPPKDWNRHRMRDAARSALSLPRELKPPLEELVISVIVDPGVRTELAAPLYTLLKDAFDKITPDSSHLRQYRPMRGKRLLWDPAAGIKDETLGFDASDYIRMMTASDLVITKGESSIITELRTVGTPYVSISHSGQEHVPFFETDSDSHLMLSYPGLDAHSLCIEITDFLVKSREVRPKMIPPELQNGARNAANRLKELLLSVEQ